MCHKTVYTPFVLRGFTQYSVALKNTPTGILFTAHAWEGWVTRRASLEEQLRKGNTYIKGFIKSAYLEVVTSGSCLVLESRWLWSWGSLQWLPHIRERPTTQQFLQFMRLFIVSGVPMWHQNPKGFLENSCSLVRDRRLKCWCYHQQRNQQQQGKLIQLQEGRPSE